MDREQGDQVDQMQERLGALGEQIEGARHEWESRRADPSVPGAPPDEADDHDAADPEPNLEPDRECPPDA